MSGNPTIAHLIHAIVKETLGTKSFRKRELARNKRLGFKAEDWIKIKLKAAKE